MPNDEFHCWGFTADAAILPHPESTPAVQEQTQHHPNPVVASMRGTNTPTIKTITHALTPAAVPTNESVGSVGAIGT